VTNITYVDSSDKIIGYGSRDEAINDGIIHIIVRLLVFNSNGEILIQKRSHKVKMPNKWDQSAGGHVDEGEGYEAAGKRELLEEMGIETDNISFITKFYTEKRDSDGVTRRFNSLFALHGYDGKITVDNDEVSGYKWISPEKLARWMSERLEDFTAGFLKTYDEYSNLKS